MFPISFKHANKNIEGIPVNHTHGQILSRWSMTWRERLSVLWYGTIWVSVKGDHMHPLLLSGNQQFRIEERDNE